MGKLLLRRFHKFMTTTILGGIVVVLPVSIFILGVRFIFKLILRIITPISNVLDLSEHTKRWIADLTSLGLVIALFFLIGLVVRTSLGKRLFQLIEDTLLSQLPFYMVVRDTVQQLIGTKKMPFSSVVLVDVFGNATRMTGFVVDEHEPSGMLTVFVPTAPNPTNGFIFHVQKDQVVYLDVKPEEAIRSVVGIGIGSAVLFEAKDKLKP